ncbi:MAG: molecular chaperone DnaJ [Tissierellia bacterium]|nr:molecular chaperone DnaJ [Tissierellia bacterium]
MRNLYEILEVEVTATHDEIKKSYRRLAKKYHPDLNPDDEEASERLKEINLAYEVLSDPNKRSKYDTYGDAIFDNAGNAGGGFGGFDDIFGSIFNDFFGGYDRQSSANRPYKGEDISMYLNIEFNEAVFGCEKEVNIRRREECKTCDGSGAKPGTEKKRCQTCGGSGQVSFTQESPFGRFVRRSSCPDCEGTGEVIEEKCDDCRGEGFVIKNKKINVKIPEGVDNDSVIRVSGEGHCGVNGGSYGDLYIGIRVKEHEFFERHGLDIFYELPLRFAQMTLGDEIEVPLLDGVEKFEIPAGTQSGTVFKLKGKGIKSPRANRVGDIHFRVNVITPTKLTDEQVDLLKKFDELGGNETKGHKKKFFEKVKDIFE